MSLRIGSGSPRGVTSAISASMRQRIEVNVVSSLHPRGIVVVEVLLVVVEVDVLVDVLTLVGGVEVVGMEAAVDDVVVDDEVVVGAVVLVVEVDGGGSHRPPGGVAPPRGSGG